MTIKEIEARTGLPRASVRFYEAQGLIHPGRGENGYRDYTQEDCQTLLKIKLLRQLDCTLEDIRALQAGERAMDAVLQARLTELERRHAQLDQARRLCEKLREDRVDWAGLEPERYLDWTPAPPPEEVADIRFRIPWRRYFARMLDYLLYGTVWSVLLALIFRVNILQRGTFGGLLDTAVTLGMMAVLEPLFLHRWGTTPGKALFRLKLTRSDGSHLSLQEGFQRTWRVILMGMGLSITVSLFVLIPLVTMILGYIRCKKGREQPWALEDEAWSDGTDGRSTFGETRGSGRRVAGYVGIRILAVAITIGAALFAAVPRYHGDLTAEEFAANYNHLAAFAAAPDAPGHLLQPDGSWLQTEANSFPIFLFSPGPLAVELRSDGGTVTGLSFSMEDREQGEPRSLPLDQAMTSLYAIQGRGMLLVQGAAAQIARELAQAQPGRHTWQLGEWTVAWTLECRGYHTVASQGLLFPEEGQTQYLRYDFSIEQTKGGN